MENNSEKNLNLEDISDFEHGIREGMRVAIDRMKDPETSPASVAALLRTVYQITVAERHRLEGSIEDGEQLILNFQEI